MSDLHGRAKAVGEVGKVYCFIKTEAVWCQGSGKGGAEGIAVSKTKCQEK